VSAERVQGIGTWRETELRSGDGIALWRNQSDANLWLWETEQEDKGYP